VVGCDKYIDKDAGPGRDPQILLAIALEIQWPVRAQKRTPSTVTMQTKQFSKWGDRWYQAWEDNSTDFESEFYSPQILQIYSPSPATSWSTPYNISSQIDILSFYGFNSTTDLTLYSDLEQVGVISGTMSLCRIEFRAHAYKDGVIENGRWSISKVEEAALNPTGFELVPNSTFNDPRKNFTYNAVGIADAFRIGVLSFSPLEQQSGRYSTMRSSALQCTVHRIMGRLLATGTLYRVDWRCHFFCCPIIHKPRSEELYRRFIWARDIC
jgi:hypothetical protein